MKLVAIMSVDAYAGLLEEVYAEHHIPVFSEMDVQGFHLEDSTIGRENWFGRSHAPVESKLTFAFVSDDQARLLLDTIELLNDNQALKNPIRAFQLLVERSVPNGRS